MKVKIQFTVDMNDVPAEVRERVNNIYRMAEDTMVDISSTSSDIKDGNILEACKKIDAIRKNLSFMDSVMGDSYSVLTGYLNYSAKSLEAKSADIESENKDENEK